MYITSRFLLPLVFCALLGGCAGVSPTRIIGDTIGAAGGALIGSAVSKGDPLIAAAGAGGGLLVSEALQAGSSSANQKSYASGYEKGRSDAAKQQFQALINQQRTAPGIDDAANIRLLDAPLSVMRVTTISFPSPISAVDGALITADAKTPGLFQIAHTNGTAYLSIRALAKGAVTNLNIRWNDRTYVFELRESLRSKPRARLRSKFNPWPVIISESFSSP